MSPFPSNPFPDVLPSDFHKLNKKHVSEDYVGENFRLINWEVYSPFNDTGIDRVISKDVCPNGHTKYNENLNQKQCPTCKSDPLKIYRFIQVKTRELKGSGSDLFGYTLKTKDFRTDPRHIFLFYSDHTNDFLLLSVYDYLEFFKRNSFNDHSAPTFKQGNGKNNSLRYNLTSHSWSFKGVSWEDFKNVNGVTRMQNPKYDIDIRKYMKSIVSLKNDLFYTFSGGRTFTPAIVTALNQYINQNVLGKNDSDFVSLKQSNLASLGNMSNPIKESINNCYNKYNGLKVI